jgi:glycosyltransferase involved in cell wall biosynthesis
MHVAIITAGGAGMFCGSCMHDNTWARALLDAGAEVTLIPTYTPIRVDEESLSSQRVFFGGINIYLEHRWQFWRRLPRWMTRWLDHPRLLDLATRGAVSNDAKQLGDLTLEMLAGDSGPQRQQVEELARFLADELKPDLICFSNALLAGALPRIQAKFSGPVLCTLQGDDIFLDSLTESYRARVSAQLSEKAQSFDGFLVHSDYYRDYMAERLSLPRERFRKIPLGIDVGDAGEITGSAVVDSAAARSTKDNEFRVGYFARICPEKGLHLLVEAFRILRQRLPNVRLVAGGYLGKRDEAWFAKLRRDAQDLGDSFEYIGSPPDHESKVAFLRTLDVLSVPTVYHEPKGLFALEAMVNGIPVVLPSHGAFPEMIARAGGGLLFEPGRPDELAASLEALLKNPDNRAQLAQKGHDGVREFFSAEVMARESLAVFREYLDRPGARCRALGEDADTA